jgi:hypothetical protein
MDTLAELAVLLVVVGFAVAVALACLVCTRPRPCRSCRRRSGQHHRAGAR